MALTCGFYGSLDGDRKYNAKQFGSIFDGVIHDGIYINIGERMVVSASGDGMKVNIQTGRAWFNHTWTLNDAIYPITLPDSEALLPKYVAVVLEVDTSILIRNNSFKIISGEPSSTPSYPQLINSETLNQYPLAYIYIKEGAVEIKQSDITNMVGTSKCPFVTSVAASMNVDELIVKWEDQWNQWFVSSQAKYSSLITSFYTFLNEKEDEFDTSLNNMKTDFGSFWGDFRIGMQEYLNEQETIWENWFEHIKGQLSEDTATHLQDQIDQINYIYVDGHRAILGSWAVTADNKVIVAKPAA